MKTDCKPLTCSEAEELMFDYLDGELSESQAARLLSHVENCSGCRAELDERQKILDLAADAEWSVPSSLRTDVMRRIEEIPQEKTAKILTTKKRFVPWGTIAAACAVVMILVAGRGTIHMGSAGDDIAAERTIDRVSVFSPAITDADKPDAHFSEAAFYSGYGDENETVVVETTSGVSVLSPTTGGSVKEESAPGKQNDALISRLDAAFAAALTDNAEQATLILYASDFIGLEPDTEAVSFLLGGEEITCYRVAKDAQSTFTGCVSLFEQQKIDYRAIIPADSDFEACEIWLLGDEE